MSAIPQGLFTMEHSAQQLRVPLRRLRELTAQTDLGRIRLVSLGRSLGSFRLFPQLGLLMLRQLDSGVPLHLRDWQAALAALLASRTWQEATAQVAAQHWQAEGGRVGRATIDRLLLSPRLLPAMTALHQESRAVLHRYGLEGQLQQADFIVDRLEDEDDAVVLVGPTTSAFLVPRLLLREVQLEYEGAQGVLSLLRTGRGVDLLLWPVVGVDRQSALVLDDELLALRYEVGIDHRASGVTLLE